MCQFTYYKEEEKGTYYPQLYCHITNGFCLYRKRCVKEGKFILIDGDSWKDCYIMNDYLFKQDAPKGAYKVVAHNVRKSGKVELYVRIDSDTTVKVEIPKTDEIPTYVFLDKIGTEYKVLDKPKTEEKEKPKVEKKETTKKVTNNKKKK